MVLPNLIYNYSLICLLYVLNQLLLKEKHQLYVSVETIMFCQSGGVL